MNHRFDSFVVFAEMRTGSNFLETNINSYPDLSCVGEAFNPHFIGYPSETELLGVSQHVRDADPLRLLDAIRNQPEGLAGFRYFHDHDPRVLDSCLDDARCAKVILTRNPLDSYVSWKIAQDTGQWKLTNVKSRKDGKAQFDADEFEAHVRALQAFQVRLLNRLQTSGQTAFYLAYEDLQSVEVMNGLARYLGSAHQLETLDKTLKRQNPAPVAEKVANPGEMAEGLRRIDQFNLSRTPNFEPRRGPNVPTYVAAARAPLMYLPVRGGPERAVTGWLAALDGVTRGDLPRKFSQKTLRHWMRDRPGHRSFTVVRHPLARAHSVFCTKILATGDGAFGQIRRTLRRAHGFAIPETMPDAGYDRAAHRTAFAQWLRFVRANLNGQTGVRVDAQWASQATILQGLAEFAIPAMVLREEEMPVLLPLLAKQVGRSEAPVPETGPADLPFTLGEIHDRELDALARAAYQRDYLIFGFGDWSDTGPNRG